MNKNKIDLADIYGLNENNSRSFSKTINARPISLEQLARNSDINTDIDNSSTDIDNSNAEDKKTDINNLIINNNMNSNHSGNNVNPDKCLAGRCRFDDIPHTHTSENQDKSCKMCNKDTDSIKEYNQPYPITANNIQYLNSFIRTQIGRRVHVEFLVGNNNIVEKNGYLVAVGANFILLNPIDTNDMIACDFYNIKFMKFYY